MVELDVLIYSLCFCLEWTLTGAALENHRNRCNAFLGGPKTGIL